MSSSSRATTLRRSPALGSDLDKGKRGRPMFSPGLSLVSATRHHYHHLLLTYVAGNLVHWTRGVSCTHWLTELAGLTGALHAHDQPPWRHEQNALPLAARLTLTHPQSCKQPSMQSCEIIVVLGIELKLPKLSVDMVNSRGDVCVLNIPLRKLTMVLL